MLGGAWSSVLVVQELQNLMLLVVQVPKLDFFGCARAPNPEFVFAIIPEISDPQVKDRHEC